MPKAMQVVWDLDNTAFTLWGYPVRWYSLCWCVGLGLAYYVVYRSYKDQHIPQERFEPLFLYCFLGTLVGARVGHCFFYEAEYFLAHPLEIILPIHVNSEGSWQCTGYTGLASHGGIIGLLLALILYCRRNKMKFMHVLDNIALGVPFTACCIRIGNLLNSEIVGKATSGNFGFVFVQNGENFPRHPAQLYESAAYLLIGIVGLLVYRYNRHHNRHIPGSGFQTGLCMTLAFAFRFGIEFIKEVQEPWEQGMKSAIGIDQGQLLSVPFILVGLYLLCRKKAAFANEPHSSKKTSSHH